MRNLAKGLALTQLIPKNIFNQLVAKWGVDKGVTKLNAQKLLNTLVLSTLFQRLSLRDISCSFGVAKSTLDDALAKRPYGFFEELCSVVLKEILLHVTKRKEKKAVRDLLAMDSAICHVHGSMIRHLDCRKDNKTAAIKLHAVWNVSGEWIEDFRITGCRKNDLTIGKTFQFLAGKMYVFDRGYVDLGFWLQIQKANAHFVTRLKRDGMRLNHIHKSVLNTESFDKTGVLYDGIWTPSESSCARNKVKPKILKYRHIIYRDPVSKKLLDFITSDFHITAIEVANIYKKRWSVELLFRWLKGHLNIRRVSLKNKNGIKIQLAIVVLVQLLNRLKMLVDCYQGTCWEHLRQLRTYLDRLCLQKPSGARIAGFNGLEPRWLQGSRI